MKQPEKIQTGMINSDGALAMYMGELKDFFSKWKNSKVIARFTIYRPGTSAALKGYYYNYVVPTMKAAIWEAGDRKTEEETEKYLRQMSPIMYEQIPNPATGRYESRIKEIPELSDSELVEHIETIKQIAAEEYGVFVEDPKTY